MAEVAKSAVEEEGEEGEGERGGWRTKLTPVRLYIMYT